MRIVSRFKDYYDIGMGLGYDSHADYIRTEWEEDVASNRLLSKYKLYYEPRYADGILIGVCGKFYPAIAKENPLLEDREKEWFFSPKGYKPWYGEPDIKQLNRFFSQYKNVVDLEPFIASKSPTVVIKVKNRRLTATWNARLRDYNFARILSPYDAFQTIDMFMCNLASPEKLIPAQSDLQKIQSHGFDKQSFRKGKSK